MINTSEAFKEIMRSNIRPKCEPVITISGKDENDNDFTLTWKGKDIKNLKYKRGIDPIGRSLPFIELEWTEIYKGKLDEQSYPEKYKNIAKYMQVNLSFVQNLGFYNTWKNIFLSGTTWKNIFDEGLTWKELKRGVSTQTVTLPTMFLVARPVVEGATIKWTARDILYFLDYRAVNYFERAGTHIKFMNPMCVLILNSRGSFLKSKQIFDSLTEMANQNYNPTDTDALDESIIIDSSAKDALKNYLNLRNLHWNFKRNFAIPKSVDDYKNEYSDADAFDFTGKLMFEYPTVENGTDISFYSFKNYYISIANYDDFYEMKYTDKFKYQNRDFYRYIFNGFGWCPSSQIYNIVDQYITSTVPQGKETIYRTYKNSIDNSLTNEGIDGESFVEDNPLNPYPSSSLRSVDRFNFLKDYFNKNSATLRFSALANPSLEPGDIVKVETNLYKNNQKITKTAMIIEMEITYNGAVRENIIAHEVNMNDN